LICRFLELDMSLGGNSFSASNIFPIDYDVTLYFIVLDRGNSLEYSVKKLADLAGISVRTLHYYDEVGLLKPQSYDENRYRKYGEKELLRLQQILFFRELDFSLDEIKEIINRPDFDVLNALQTHLKLLTGKIIRLNRLIKTIDNTILNLKGELKMKEEDYYKGFSREQQEKYEQEIREKYGNTALDESKRRMKGWTKKDYQKTQDEGDQIFTAIRDTMSKGFSSPEVQKQIQALHHWLNHFYNCNHEMLLGLGHMYNDRPDFVKMWKTKYHEKMPEFLLQAIEYYCKEETK
jgi:DNA-binding transcriptional MerR regulator